MSNLPNAQAFRDEIKDRKERAKLSGSKSIVILSKELHDSLGGNKGKHHVMPSCCEAMYSSMKPGDEVIYAPPKGRGSTVEIRYYV